MRKTRLFSLLTALALTLTLWTPAAHAAEVSGADGWLVPQRRTLETAFSDVGTDFWCADAVRTAYEARLLDGYYTGAFGPGNPLTNAHAAAVCARLLSLLTGGDGNIPLLYDDAPWYAGYYAALDSALGSDYTLRALTPEEPCRRESFARALYEVLEAAQVTLPEKNAVAAVPDVDGGSDEGALALYRAGILNGMDEYGSLRGGSTLNRGQAAALLARLIDPAQRLTFSLRSFDLCRDVLGLDPNTVLLTADGADVTAEVFGPQLVTSLLQWGAQSTGSACTDALRIFRAYDESVFALARTQQITLTDSQNQDAAAAGAVQAGYLGCGAAYWERMHRRSALGVKLEDWYLLHDEHDGKTAASSYHTALDDAAAALVLKPAPALAALDLSAVRARALSAPLGTWLGLS
jgi:hypothetical protein